MHAHILVQLSTLHILSVINGKMCQWYQTVVTGAGRKCSPDCVQFSRCGDSCEGYSGRQVQKHWTSKLAIVLEGTCTMCLYHHQTCIAANRIIVQDGIIDEYMDKLIKRVAELRLGPGFTEGVNQGPLINQPAIDKVCYCSIVKVTNLGFSSLKYLSLFLAQCSKFCQLK